MLAKVLFEFTHFFEIFFFLGGGGGVLLSGSLLYSVWFLVWHSSRARSQSSLGTSLHSSLQACYLDGEKVYKIYLT